MITAQYTICYGKPYDGATADSEMDRHAVEFLATMSEPKATTFVADRKIVTGPLISLMEEYGFGFISKCPNSFRKRVRKRVIDSIESALCNFHPSVTGEIYDTDADLGDRGL